MSKESKEISAEKPLVVELFNIDSRSVKETSIVMGSDDEYAEFLGGIREIFERDLERINNPYWGKSHDRRRSKREMRDIHDQIPEPEDMREFISVLDGKTTDKRIQLLIADDGDILGYNLKGTTTEVVI